MVLFVLPVLGMEPRLLGLLSKGSTIELHSWPFILFLTPPLATKFILPIYREKSGCAHMKFVFYRATRIIVFYLQRLHT